MMTTIFQNHPNVLFLNIAFSLEVILNLINKRCMYITVYAQNRNRILVKWYMNIEHGLQHFLWYIAGSICIPEDVVPSSYILGSIASPPVL